MAISREQAFGAFEDLGSTITDLQAMEAIAEAHGLKAWFSGRSDEGHDETDYWIVVKFEAR
jgi:hypothetical protein